MNKPPGLAAERLAGKYLRGQGYRVVEERCRTKFGELDLICRKGREIVFVEVKSVESEAGFIAEEGVNPKKIEHIVKSAKSWLMQKKLADLEVRFDVIAVDLKEAPPLLKHYPAAFESPFDL